MINKHHDYNNRKYCENSDCVMWNRNVAFGFHQFSVELKKANAYESPIEKYKIIWNKYSTYLANPEQRTDQQLPTLHLDT
jgi:hypothetical protein